MKLNVDVEKQIAQFNFENLIRARKKPVSRFVIGSLFIHVLSASAIHELGQIPQPEKKQEIVEIDFSTAPSAEMESAPVPAPEVEEAAPLLVTQDEPVQNPVPVPVLNPNQSQTKANSSPLQVVQTQVAQKNEPKSSAASESKPVIAKRTAPGATQKEANPAKPVEPIMALQADLISPLSQESEAPTITKKEPDDNTAKSDPAKKFSIAEANSTSNATGLEKDLNQDTSAAEAALNDQLKEAEAAAHAENTVLASQAQARLDALKSERAAQSSNSSSENGAGHLEQSAGPGKNGELRTLDQLRQMPGNPKPDYSSEERLHGQQGAVIFKAFVTTEGQLTSFELLQSTGHRNLDFKTLKALKQWKFYPGQQGWVELPFKWDLKGGPQEMPTLLRRRVSQQN